MDNRQFLSQQLMWIGISLGISLAISFVVPFPYSLAIIIAVFILLNFYMRKRAMKKMGIMSGTMFGNSSLNYYCMSCGTKHNQTACPKCGSKMKRVGS
jgi:cobalamin synthase